MFHMTDDDEIDYGSGGVDGKSGLIGEIFRS